MTASVPSKTDELSALAAGAITHGLAVIVVNAETKRPFRKGVGCTSAEPTRDMAIIAELLKQYAERAAVAIVAGENARGGYSFAIDIDPPEKKTKPKEENTKFSLAALESLEAEFGPLDTFGQVSKHGGLQLWFRSNTPVPARSPGAFRPHVEVLGVTGTGSGEYGLLYQAIDHELAKADLKLIEAIGAPRPAAKAAPLVLVPNVDPARGAARAIEYLKTAPAAIEGSGGYNVTVQVAQHVMDYGPDPAEAARLMLEFWNDRCAPPWSAAELTAKVADLARSRHTPLGSADPAADFDAVPAAGVAAPVEVAASKPDAIHTDRPLHELATLGERALVAGGAPFYVQGPRLVRPIIEKADAADGRHTKTARLAEVTPDSLVDWLSRCVSWVRYDARSKKTLSADPPRPVAGVILSRDGEWTFRRLAGVITTPTLRPDGSLLSEPGYDRATRLLLLDPPAMPSLSASPTRDEALRALADLQNLLAEFPFVDEPSRAVALSALITPVVRGALPVAPLHAARAPTAGSGKSFLIDLASAIATGQLCPVISAGASEEEAEKRLGAAVLTGQPIVSIDNLNGDLSGDALCQLIERPVVEIRPLGRSELIRIESRATIYATGNNLSPRGDVVRRVLLCSLDANLERPELRQFDGDPLKKVLADRGRYVAACLTIVRAYIVAGCPAPRPVLASFGQWSKLVRSALTWLGCADAVDSMETARNEDPETLALAQIVGAWQATIGADAVTVGELVSRATAWEGASAQVLRDALVNVAGDKGNPVPQKLGAWLKRHEGRIAGGLKIVGRRDGHLKQTKWTVQPVCGYAGMRGYVSSPLHADVTGTPAHDVENDSSLALEVKNYPQLPAVPANPNPPEKLNPSVVDIFN